MVTLIFYKCLKFLKYTQNFRFLFQKISPHIFAIIINEEKKMITFIVKDQRGKQSWSPTSFREGKGDDLICKLTI